MKQRCLFWALLLLSATVASATSCPGGLAPLFAANFGGSGIDNTAVCQETASAVTVGMIAHGRFANPTVTNNGVDTFFAGNGGDVLSIPSAACPLGACAKWNFASYVHNGSNTAISFTISWDTNPANGNVGDHGFFTQILAAGATWQDSWNNGFGFVDTGVPIPSTYSPSAVVFNPAATGTYAFSLKANGVTGGQIAGVGIDVVVGDSAVPEPGTFGLLAVALGGLTLLPGRWRLVGKSPAGNGG